MEIEARGAEQRAIYVGKKRPKELGRRAFEGKRERERERGLLLVLYSIYLVRKMTWLSY